MDDMDIINNNIGLEKFKEDVTEYDIIDKQIKENELRIKPIKEKIASLKKEKKEIKKEICVFMNSNKFDKCNLPDNKGSLTYKAWESLIPVSKATIEEDLKRYFCVGPGNDVREFNKKTNTEKGESIHHYLYDKERRERRITDVLTKR